MISVLPLFEHTYYLPTSLLKLSGEIEGGSSC